MTREPRWWVPPLLAVQFLTRVPVPGLDHLDIDTVRAGLTRAVSWFPVVGALIGCVTAIVLLLADTIWPRVVAVIIALIADARLTGAFHEDAVADFCDGFGGGMTAPRIHEIMKDSRIGSFGAVGLGLALALRAALLIALPSHLVLPALIASASFGRWMPIALMTLVQPYQPAGDQTGGLGKDVGGQTTIAQWSIATLFALVALLPLALAKPLAVAIALGAALLFVAWFRRYLLRHLGGVTGDCLGFAVYVGQLLILLAAAATRP